MRHLQVRDIVTADPVTVTAGTQLKNLAGILVSEKTSGVPVLSLQGEIVGVATERDLLKKRNSGETLTATAGRTCATGRGGRSSRPKPPGT